VTSDRGLHRSACVCLLVGLFLPWGAPALAGSPAPGDVEKVRAVLISVDKAGRSIVYERSHKQLSARVNEATMPKLAGMRTGQVVDLWLQQQHDQWPLVYDAKKPRNKRDYVLFVIGALFVMYVPAG
jgi:hypothetical protein